jgi:16S rRNA G966 N2-methylase RsmD
MKITDYFTEDQRIKCSVNANKSPLELFKSKQYLRKILANEKVVSSFIIREQIWKMSKECTLFKNTLVVDICKHYNAKSYLDISAGWGDRLIGALAAGVDKYVGYDPNINLKQGHQQIQKMFDKKKTSRIYYEPFQTASISPDSFDLVLSSPPYFDFETYTTSSTQSDKTFRSLDEWLAGFLFVSISKAWAALKFNGNMIIHIDDVKGYNIVSPMIAYMKTLPCASNVTRVYVDGRKGKLRPMFHLQKMDVKLKKLYHEYTQHHGNPGKHRTPSG